MARSLSKALIGLGLCHLTRSQGTDLGDIITRTNVDSFADLSQDVAEISNLLNSNQPEKALEVYNDGLHSFKSAAEKRSLKSLADEMATSDSHTPSFLFHLYGQNDRSLNLAFDSQKLQYINNLVDAAIAQTPAHAVEAIWITNLWMYATHLLYYGMFECERRSSPQANPNILDVGMAGWDEFIALWIGSGQTAGQTNGDSLYTWAEQLGDAMDPSNTSPEATVNTRVKLLYSEAVTIMSSPNACTSSNQETAGQLWKLVIQMVSEMTKPLFQGFLSALLDGNVDRVNIYAQALVPQMSKCRPSLYKRFYEALILNRYAGDDTTLQGLLNDIPEITTCFGYGCGELGNTRIGACNNFDASRPNLAGYLPSTPVGMVSRADLDVYQIKILTELASNDFAKYLYMYGANIAKFRQGNDPLEYVSLHDVAISSERSSAQPWFDAFVGYNGEKDYADKVITAALSGGSKWKAAQQISAIVTTTAAHQVLLMEAVTKLKIAVEECRDADPNVGPSFVLNPIDETAALMIGSMEGSKLGGSSDLEDGQLNYNINNKHAFQFGTINPERYADSVSTIEDLLFAAKAELDALDCNGLERTADRILSYAMVGIAQGGIFDAVNNAELSEFSTAASLAEGEGLAFAILPLIHEVDKEAADEIRLNMERQQGTQPVPSGGPTVGKLFGKGFTHAMKIRCSNLGSLQVVDPCDGEWGNARFSSAFSVTAWSSMAWTMLLGASLIFLTL